MFGYLACTASSVGIIFVQWPHHGAKMTTTRLGVVAMRRFTVAALASFFVSSSMTVADGTAFFTGPSAAIALATMPTMPWPAARTRG